MGRPLQAKAHRLPKLHLINVTFQGIRPRAVGSGARWGSLPWELGLMTNFHFVISEMVVTVGGPENLPSTLYLVFCIFRCPEMRGWVSQSQQPGVAKPGASHQESRKAAFFPFRFYLIYSFNDKKKKDWSFLIPSWQDWLHTLPDSWVCSKPMNFKTTVEH